MKIFIFSAEFLFLVVLSACSESKVPEAAKQAFKQKFPDAKSVKWDKEEGNYEAEFKLNGSEMSATYDSSGTWLETEALIKIKELPEAILQTIKSQFHGYETEEAEKVERASGDMIYEVEIEKDEQSLEVTFTADGKVVSKKVEEGDED